MIFFAKILKKLIYAISAVVFLIAVSPARVNAQSVWEKTDGYYLVRGIVTDSITGEPLPYASVTLSGGTGGAVADSKGVFEFRVPARATALHAAMVGYAGRDIPLRQTSHNIYVVRLMPEASKLRELVVRRKKYSKKNNPAVDFVRRIRSMDSATDPKRRDNYSYRRYERVTMALNNFEHTDSDAVIRRMPFLLEHVDTSEITGRPVLPVSVHETLSRHYYRRSPQAEKRIVLGTRAEGVDGIVDPQSMQTFIEEVLREVDLYDNDITLMQNRFVSPLSPIGPDFYKYYLTDTVSVDGERCVVLSFYPHNKAAFGFSGHLYVPMADTTMFIKRVDMRVPRDINLNFVENLLLSQSFEKAPDGSRLKTKDDLVAELSLIRGTQSLYVRRSTAYDSHSFDAPADTTVLSSLGHTVEADSARLRSAEWWESARLKPMSGRGESRVGDLLDNLRKVPLY